MITLEQHLAAHALSDLGGQRLICSCGWMSSETDYPAASGEYAEHVAATWQEARTVRTVEELDALAALSIIRESIGSDGLTKTIHGTWRCDDESTPFTAPEITLPAVILWTPEDVA